MANKYLDDNGLLYLWNKLKAYFVASETGKGLSTNDFTTEEKTKLSGIENGANKTVVENNLTSTSKSNALAAAQGKILDEKIKSLSDNMSNLGYGDMMKATYDTNNNGQVDKADDSDKLGGKNPSYYAPKSTTLTGYGITDAYTKTQVDNAIATAVANADHLKRTIVDALPAVSSVDVNTIYMVLEDSTSGDNKYVEYMVINGAWEKTGDTDVDLSDYMKNEDMSTITNSEIDIIVAT